MRISLLNSISLQFVKLAGLLDYPKKLYKEILQWATYEIARRLQHYLLQYPGSADNYDESVSFLKKIQRTHKPNYNVPFGTKDHAEHIFVFYEQDIKKLQEKLKTYNSIENDKVRVFIYFYEDLDNKISGLYEQNVPHMIKVGIRFGDFSPESLRDFFQELSEIILHEIQHLWQACGDELLSQFNTYGNPPRKNRSNKYIEPIPFDDKEDKKILSELSESNPDYVLNDIEFYPYLTESIKHFQDVSRYESDDWLKQHARYWVRDGDVPGQLSYPELIYGAYGYDEYQNALHSYCDFFTKLKEKDFGKWKKAVKEFYKAVL